MDSLEYLGKFFKTNTLNSTFDKQLNTFHLLTRLQIYGDFENVLIRLNENFNSSFTRNEINNTRDEQHLNLNARYSIIKNYWLGVSANSSVLSDNRSLGINETSVNYATLFGELKPLNELRISPFGGYSSNRQIGLTDTGPVYGIEGTLDNIFLSELKINSDLRFRNEDILPRRNMIRFYGLSVGNTFDKNIANNIKAIFSQNRKDFYFTADSITASQFNIQSNIQSRTETSVQLFDRLSYDRVLEIFSLDLSGGLNYRNINRDIKYKSSAPKNNLQYDTSIDELKLEFDGITRYSSEHIEGILRLNYYERDEKHQVERFDGFSDQIYEQFSELEEQKNNNSTRASISLSGNAKFSESDFLNFSLFQNKLVYDTKSSENDDDRDEILSIIRLKYLKNLNAFFSVFVNAEYTYGHTVYIFSSRSSNNNKNRILKLRAGGDYISLNVNSYNSFEVSANYTVYDFEEISTNYQSYAFRQFTAIDSTTISLTEKTSLFFYGYLKLSEIGDFSWSDFSSQPTRYLQEIYFEPRLILTNESAFFSAGLRLFSLNTYSYQKSNRLIDSEFLSLGPIAVIQIGLFNNLIFIARGYYEFIYNTNTPDKQQASLFMQLNWNF